MLNLKALLSSSVSMKGILSQLGTKIEYDLQSLNHISVYESLHNPGSLLGPITQGSGLYDFLSSIEAIDMGFNVSTFIGNGGPRHFNYSSSDDNALGSMITSAMTSLNVITQDIFNAVIHIGANLNGAVKKKQQVQYLETSQHHNVFWLVVIGIAFLSFHMIYFYFYSTSKQKYFTIRKKKQR